MARANQYCLTTAFERKFRIASGLGGAYLRKWEVIARQAGQVVSPL